MHRPAMNRFALQQLGDNPVTMLLSRHTLPTAATISLIGVCVQ
jgi:hypothetical protein